MTAKRLPIIGCAGAFLLGGAFLQSGVHAAERSPITVSVVGAAEQIPATVIKLEGGGPFPAVVMMHDCSGLGPRSSGAPRRWADELVAQGYVVLIPDSFTARGFADGVCVTAARQRSRVNGDVRAADAYGALAALRALPYVDGKRIGIMGGSHGAWSTANTATLGEARYTGVYQPIAPLLILKGEKDDWTPAEPCRQLAERSRAAGHPVEIKIYSDAHHAFDNDRPLRYVAQRKNGLGATTGGNPAAWADARQQVSAFFTRHLKP